MTSKDADRVMRELGNAVTRGAERARVHMLAAEALMFGADPTTVRSMANLHDLERRLVERLRQEFSADDEEVEREAQRRLSAQTAFDHQALDTWWDTAN